jgi:phage protein U
MRLEKFGPAVIAATSLLALAPAAASAHKHPSPLGRCAINIRVAPRLITAGEQVEVRGRLKCIPRALAGSQAVTLYEHVAGTAGYIPAQSTTTDASGFYQFKPPALNANTSFYVRSHGAQSGHEKARVALQVTLTGPPEGTQITTGAPNQQTFSGTVSPADVGARVILQRQNAVTGNEWHRIGFGSVEAGGNYTITHTFRVPGDASIRVLVRSDRINSPSASTPLEYDISQAQNPSLTIVSSADPIIYGQSATISGLLAGATTPQTVTLLARTVHQHGFAPIAEVSTDTSGNYSFPAQAPVNSTLYRVQGAGQKSAVLYEGVKNVLTAEVSPSTVQAGEALTFKGTVAPDHTGHVIYLERQNAAGTAFHVVQVGHVLPGSVYSIVHQVYVPGTKVFRVEIPGGPDNGRAVSQLFTIQVTPAPASALTPEAPGNSSLPAEGQTEGSEVEAPLKE